MRHWDVVHTICDCVTTLPDAEIDTLPVRDDKSLAVSFARQSRLKWLLVALIGGPVVFILGVIELFVVTPLPGVAFLIGGPVLFLYGLVGFLAVKPVDPTSPAIVFAWLLKTGFPFRNNVDQDAARFILPSSRDRPSITLEAVRLMAAAEGTSFELTRGTDPDELAPVFHTHGARRVAALRCGLLKASEDVRRRKLFASVVLWAVESPAKNWWLVLHSRECVNKGVVRRVQGTE